MSLSPETSRFVRMALSSLMAGAIGVGTNLLSAINASGEVPRGSLVIALISGGVLVAKDLQSYLSTPPAKS